jgi:hypothetical protein
MEKGKLEMNPLAAKSGDIISSASLRCSTVGPGKVDVGLKNLRGDFRRLIQVHIESYKHNLTKKPMGHSLKAEYKLEAMEAFLESAIKSDLVGEDF